MIATASANHQGSADVSTSHVCWTSILSRMYATASVVSVSPIAIRSGRFTCDRRGTPGMLMPRTARARAGRLDGVQDVVVRVRGRERQRENLVPRALGDRQRRLRRVAARNQVNR